MELKELEVLLNSQADILKLLFGFVDSMALNCAVELRIADVIHSHGGPITLSQLAASLNLSSPGIPLLARIMRLLARKKIFTVHHPSDGGETLYGLTEASRWLLHGTQCSLVPMVKWESHPWQLAPWHYLSECVRDGGAAFNKAHGCDIWDFASQNPEFNGLLNNAMGCAAKIVVEAILSGYKLGFGAIGSLVDVGGGTGGVIAEIVKSYPHIKGINFDLPHVVATAQEYQGVTHVGGNMFETIPGADALLLKWVLHDWSDEQCIKILKNCKKAIPEKNGKVIIVDMVLEPEGNEVLDDTRIAFDLHMITNATGGKERTKSEWEKLLDDAGFSRYNFIKIPAIPSLIEAYPN